MSSLYEEENNWRFFFNCLEMVAADNEEGERIVQFHECFNELQIEEEEKGILEEKWLECKLNEEVLLE